MGTTTAFVKTGADTIFILFVPPLSVFRNMPSGVKDMPLMKVGEALSPLLVTLISFTLDWAVANCTLQKNNKDRLVRTSLFMFYRVITVYKKGAGRSLIW